MNRIRVGLIGYGYWGPNLLRNFMTCPLTEVAAVCDANPARLEELRQTHAAMKVTASLEELLAVPLDAVAIATPVATHYALASRCLETGLHVLVEKPLAANLREAQALTELAGRRGRVLMVDHTYLFSNAVRCIKELVDRGELGELYYVDSVRINLGLFQRDINVVWDLAPHDLSIVDHVLGCEARSISAWGCAHADPDIEDIAYVNVDYGDRLPVNFHVNWLSPVKVRQMIFAGSRKSLIFNELNTAEPIKVYDRGIELDESIEDRRTALVGYRTGDVWIPHIESSEALREVVRHFAECIREDKTPLSDGALGVRVVRLLEAASRSMKAQGGRVVLTNGVHTNGHTHERTVRPNQFHSYLPGRAPGPERDNSLLREPVRLPDRG
jgi:predicted dehydrogenase